MIECGSDAKHDYPASGLAEMFRGRTAADEDYADLGILVAEVPGGSHKYETNKSFQADLVIQVEQKIDLRQKRPRTLDPRTSLWCEIANSQTKVEARTKIGQVLPLFDISSAIIVDIVRDSKKKEVTSASWEHWILVDHERGLDSPPASRIPADGLYSELSPTKFQLTFKTKSHGVCRSTMDLQDVRAEVCKILYLI